MIHLLKALKWFTLSERRIIILVLLLASTFGLFWHFVLKFPPTFGYPLHIPIMIATGRGFVEPTGIDVNAMEVPNAPKLGQFLRQEISTLKPEDIPPDLPTTTPSYFWVYYHKTMYYTIGWLWHLLGISWHIFLAFRIALFCTMAIATYGIFRLGFGRYGSLISVILLFPSYSISCLDIRDFSQAAFVLPSILILGWLIKYPVKTSRFLILASILGLIIGTGTGFRADVFACLPAALFILACCRRPTTTNSYWLRPPWALRERLLATGLLLSIFLLLSWPILAAYHTDRLSAHDFTKGLATVYDDYAGVGRSSYERVYANQDEFVRALFETHSARTRPTHEASPDRNTSREAFALCILKTFPGDMITRAYSTVLWILHGGMLLETTYPPSNLGKSILAICATIALLLIARRDLWIASLFFCLLMYFCGYLSFQAAPRHGFHLGFIPIWFIGFLINKIPPTIKKIRTLHNLQEILQLTQFKRMLLFSTLALLVILIPLYIARAIQHHNMKKLLLQYTNATLEPIPTTPYPWNNWTLFRRQTNEPPHSGTIERPTHIFHGEYWVAEFTPSPTPRPIYLRYECYRGADDFSQGLWIQADNTNSNGTTRYFFPIFEKTDPKKRGWALFSGIAIPNNQTKDFKGLYRVRNANTFPLFLNLSLPPNPSSFRDHQVIFGQQQSRAKDLVKAEAEQEGYWFQQDPDLQVPNLNDIPHLQEPDKAITRFTEALKTTPHDPILLLGLATAIDAKGNFQTTLDAYQKALTANPKFYITYHYIDAFFNRHNNIDGRINQWRTTAQTYPDNNLPYLHLAQALEEKQDIKGALKAYRQSATLNPQDALLWNDIARLLQTQNDLTGAEDAYQHLLQLDPTNPYAMADLGALKMKHSDDTGRTLLQKAIALDPKQEYAHWKLLETLCQTGDFDAGHNEVTTCKKLNIPIPQFILDKLNKHTK